MTIDTEALRALAERESRESDTHIAWESDGPQPDERYHEIVEVVCALDDAADEVDRLRAVIAEAMRIPERHEAHPIFDPVRLHAFLKGREQAWDEFRAVLAKADALEGSK